MNDLDFPDFVVMFEKIIIIMMIMVRSTKTN